MRKYEELFFPVNPPTNNVQSVSIFTFFIDSAQLFFVPVRTNKEIMSLRFGIKLHLRHFSFNRNPNFSRISNLSLGQSHSIFFCIFITFLNIFFGQMMSLKLRKRKSSSVKMRLFIFELCFSAFIFPLNLRNPQMLPSQKFWSESSTFC